MDKLIQERLLSHNVTVEDVGLIIKKISARIARDGDKPHVSVERQLHLLHELAQFEFGRFLIQNQGLNGYWTHYMLTHPWYGRKSGKSSSGKPLTVLESYLLDRAPIVLATQQRFEIFLKENQKQVKEGATLASIPSGMMGELLYLDFEGINQINLIGVDYDSAVYDDAHALARKQKLARRFEFIQRDAWHLEMENQFDLISSNGLNIYESSDDKVTALYRQFYLALKPGGKLVTSFLTPFADDVKNINTDDLILQRIIFSDILRVKWQCMRAPALTESQLSSVGFKHIAFIFDEAKLFPTVVAYKS